MRIVLLFLLTTITAMAANEPSFSERLRNLNEHTRIFFELKAMPAKVDEKVFEGALQVVKIGITRDIFLRRIRGRINDCSGFASMMESQKSERRYYLLITDDETGGTLEYRFGFVFDGNDRLEGYWMWTEAMGRE